MLEPARVNSGRAAMLSKRFPLLVAYKGRVFSISSGDAELSSEPYVATYYTTIRRRNPEVFYLLGHGR